MDINNPVIKLCIQGTQAEYQGRPDEAAALYLQAWELASNDYEACIAAHYAARFQETPEDRLHWNQTALKHAEAADQELIEPFYPSLYLNMGRSYELLGNDEAAQDYYARAAALGFEHQAD